MPLVKIANTPVEITPSSTGRRRILKFPRGSKFDQHARHLKGYAFEGAVPGGLVSVSMSNDPRNWLRFRILNGETPEGWERYREEITPLPGRRGILRPWQQEMLGFALTCHCSVVAADLGLGKTLMGLEALEAWDEAARARGVASPRFVYSAPANVLEGVQLEFTKWGCEARVDFVSHTSLPTWVEENLTDPSAIPTAFIYDESSRVRNTGTNRTNAARKLADFVRHPKNPNKPAECGGAVLLLSAKPAPKDPINWWSQAEIACPGWLEEASVKQLRNTLGIFAANEDGYPEVVAWDKAAVAELGERLAGLVGVWRKEDVLKQWPGVLKLPPVEEITLRGKPSEKLQRAAKLIVQTSETGITALTKLRQLSDGFQYRKDLITGEDLPPIRLECDKDELLRGLLLDCRLRGEDRIVIFAAFREAIEKVSDLCREEGWHVGQLYGGKKTWPTELGLASYGDLLREFDAGARSEGSAPIAFVLNAKSGGLGLNLHAALTHVWYSHDFDRESYEQSRGRGPRQGADPTKPMRFVTLTNLRTDELILKALRESADLQAITLEAIREELNK